MIFFDESKFNVFGSDGWIFVWRQANTEMDVKNMCAALKHDGLDHGLEVTAGGTGNLIFINGTMDINIFTFYRKI